MIFRSLLVPSVCLSALMLQAGAAHGQITAAPRTTRMWGFNNYGQGTIPQGLGAVSAIDCGGEFTIALTAEGSVRTWGRNDYGQLGIGSTNNIGAGRSWMLLPIELRITSVFPICEPNISTMRLMGLLALMHCIGSRR